MKCKQLILTAALVLFTFSLVAAQPDFTPGVWVDVDDVDGLIYGEIPDTSPDLIIPVTLENVDAARTAISNGFRFYSEGDLVTWTSVTGAWNPAYPWDWTHAIALGQFPPYFDNGIFVYESGNGAPYDTIGFAGLTGGAGSGLPLAFNDVAYYITVAGVTGPLHATLTMDSSWWQPANFWLWTGVAENVCWMGPYVFTMGPGTDVGFAGGALPTVFSLRQNYPNPFNPTTEVHFDVPNRSNVKIDIYNVLGRRVRTLVDEEMVAGSYIRTWDGTTESGNAVSSGVYLYRMEAGDFVDTKKMMMLK